MRDIDPVVYVDLPRQESQTQSVPPSAVITQTPSISINALIDCFSATNMTTELDHTIDSKKH